MVLEAKQMAEYLKENIAYQKLLKGIKNKYISLGEIKGNVIINHPNKEEKQALSGLMKKDYSKNKTISISLKTLQERMNNSKFAGADLKDVIEEYFQEEMITKKERKQNEQEDLEMFFDKLVKQNVETDIYLHLKAMIETKGELYDTLKKYYHKDRLKLEKAVFYACSGVNQLPREKTRIPVFASKITGNPHGFDKNTLCGNLFILLLCSKNQIPKPKTTEELAEIYYQHNLLIDDVSNMVLCKNVTGYEKVPNSSLSKKQHEGLKGFFQYHEPIFLNLYNLANIHSLTEKQKYDVVVVMENPAVFMEVSEKCQKNDFPIICTYGQVKLAGTVLLDMFIKQGYTIYYSGDIDPEGIQIADKLKQRYGEKLKFIGFDIKTYENNVSNVEISKTRITKLNKIQSQELQAISEKVKNIQKASYEEENRKAIIEFINNI